MFKKTIPLFATIALLNVGCAINQGYLQVTNASAANNELTDRENLANKLQDTIDDNYPQEKVKVLVDRYKVLVVGQFSSDESKSSVDKLIQTQYGVKSVTDYATIQAKPSLNINSSIQKEAAERLADEPNINLYNIQVIAVDHVVYLFGQAGDAEQDNVQNVITAISAMEGVIKVINLISIVNE